MTRVSVADGSTILFWSDPRNGQTLSLTYPELFSFTKVKLIMFKNAVTPTIPHNWFRTSTYPYQSKRIPSCKNWKQPLQGYKYRRGKISGNWHYTWGNSNFTAAKVYRVMIGHRPVHPIFQWIWSSRCQMKHKVFFWLLLQDRLSTRVLLRRRTMELDNYSFDHCILQKLETVTHLFLRCNFAKACWASIGAAVRTSRPLLGIFRLLKEKL